MIEPLQQLINFKYVFAALLYSALGIVVLAVSFVVFDRLTPGNLWKEIVEEHNVSLAITTAAWTLAMAIVIASAIHN